MQRKNSVLHPKNLILTLKIQQYIMEIRNPKIPVISESFLALRKIIFAPPSDQYFFFFLLPNDAPSSTESYNVSVYLVSRRG